MCSNLKDTIEWVAIAATESSSENSENTDKVTVPQCENKTENQPEQPYSSAANQAPTGSKSGEPKTTGIRNGVTSESAEGCPTSSSSSCCRICQDSADTSEPLETSRCCCKGQLARVHRSCLVEWVRYKGSNHCEICGGTFSNISPPTTLLGVNQLEHLEALRQHLAQFRPLSRRKRTALGGFILFLVMASGVTGILTFGADKEFQRVTGDPKATNHELKKAHIVFSICLSFLFFCITLTFGLIIMWSAIELYFYIQRRRLMQRTARRLVAEIRRRSGAAQSTSV